jgi:RNA polymerase sigma-70 factor (ECF subfamily)
MLDEQHERRLARGLRDGKIDAWQALYDAFAERVWRGVARLLGASGADIADVVQETMLAAAKSAASFDPERGSLWVWLWGIARNQAALHYRKRARGDRFLKVDVWRAAGDGRLLRWLEGTEPAPPGAAMSAEVSELVRATLLELPNDYAFLLSARYLDGDSVAVIASHERSTEVAIRSKLARARQAFRQAFGKRAHDIIDRPAETHHGPQ